MRTERQGRRSRRDDLVREADLLVDRVRRASRELASLPPASPERVLARERLGVLVAELGIATRRWSEVGVTSDPPRDPRIDRKLSLLSHRMLETREQLDRARRSLEGLLEEEEGRRGRGA